MKSAPVGAALLAMVLAGPALAFEISSPAVTSGHMIPARYVGNGFGCRGANVSLPLQWKDVPAGAKGLALTMFDPDAPGRGFWHWLVVDLPAGTTRLAAGASKSGLPRGAVQARSDAGVSGYFGPCPPKGAAPHRYVLTVYAVDTGRLGISAHASGANVASRLRAHTIGKASVTFTYGR